MLSVLPLLPISPIGVERYEQSAFNISEQVVHFLQNLMHIMIFFQLFCVSINLDCAQTNSQNKLALCGGIFLKLKLKIRCCFLTEIHQQSNKYLYNHRIWIGNHPTISSFFIQNGEMRKDGLQVLNWQTNSLSIVRFIARSELLELAGSDEILDQTVLYEQSIRMMNDHRFQQGLRSIFRDFFALQGLQSLTKDPLVFTHHKIRFRISAEEETLRLLEYIILDQMKIFEPF